MSEHAVEKDALRKLVESGMTYSEAIDALEGCATCETRGPKWCGEHAYHLIPAAPA